MSGALCLIQDLTSSYAITVFGFANNPWRLLVVDTCLPYQYDIVSHPFILDFDIRFPQQL